MPSKEAIRRFYLAGGTRQEALKEFRLTSGVLSRISSELKMYWSLELEDRRNGVIPTHTRNSKVRSKNPRVGIKPVSKYAGTSNVLSPEKVALEIPGRIPGPKPSKSFVPTFMRAQKGYS